MVAVLCTLMCTTSRAIYAMSQLRMLPAPLARLHPEWGTPHVAVATNAALISAAAAFLNFEALLELSMFFYCVNVLVQCAAVLKLRSSHAHLPRPPTTAPAALLALPCAIAIAVLFASPFAHWEAAALLLATTLGVYSLLTAWRHARARLRLGGADEVERAPFGSGGADGGGGMAFGDAPPLYPRRGFDGAAAADVEGVGGGGLRSWLPGWLHYDRVATTPTRADRASAAEAVQAFELQSFAADAEDLNGTPPGFRHADGTRASADGTPV